MIETILLLLIYLCVVVGVAWLVIWVFGQLGIPLPAQVIRIVWVIVVLICLLILWRAFGGHIPAVRP